jgi:hydrophobic/amphiphilic exporter-1 (mainly G- bacteria), HAE1 family
MNLTKTALQRPIFIFILMITAILIGSISYMGMRKENNPEVNFGTITVNTLYPGAGPDDVNQLITRKVEEAVSGVSGIREVQGLSNEGISAVVIQLELGVNTDTALNDVRTKVDAILNTLPKDARKPVVSKFDNSAQPILYLAVSSPTLASRELRDLIEDKISDRFAQVKGVANVGISGGDVREIQIRLKKDKLLQFGVGVLDVLNSVQAANANVPGGKFVTGGQDVSIRVKGDFVSVDQIKKVNVRVTDPKNPDAKAKLVPITELADIVDGIQEPNRFARLNGKDTVVLAIQKTKEGNTVEVNTAIKGLLPQLKKEYPLEFTVSFDESKTVAEAISDVVFSLILGIILVAAIVYIFLHNFRGTLIVALAIPTCIFAAFIVMSAAGFTINTLSMLGLSLAIGVLVDDAIVVLENIFRHLKMGEDPREAAINGRNEIGVAAIAITLADVVVFVPIATAQGIAGQFFKPLALTYVFAVLFSLFVSFTLTPLLAARWFKRGEDVEHAKGWFAVAFEKGFGRVERLYRRILEWSLNHRWFVFIAGNTSLLAVFMLIAGGSALTPKGAADIPKAMQTGMPLMFVYIVLGIIGVAGSTMSKGVITGKTTKTLHILALVGIVPAALSMSLFTSVPPKLIPVVAFFGSYISIVLLPATFIGLFKKVSARPIWGGALFGMVFPIAAIAGSFFGAWKAESVFKFGFIPSVDPTQVRATIELPVGSSLAETDRVAKIVEKEFLKIEDIEFTLTEVGKESGSRLSTDNSSTNFAEVSGTLKEFRSTIDKVTNNKDDLRDRKANRIVTELTKAVGKIPGASVRIAGVSSFNFGRAIQLALISDDREKLTKAAATIREKLASGAIDGVINPDVSVKSGKPEVRISPDLRKAADLGLDPTTLGTALRTMYQGNDDSKMRVNGREYGIRVMLDYADRNNRETLSTVPIRFSQGKPIYVDQVGTVSNTPGLTAINRRDRAEEIQVTADLLPGFANGVVSKKITDWIAKENLLPEGVRLRSLGEADAQARESMFLMLALVLGLFLVYAVLASLYNNYLYPFIIQLAQPQAMVGALLALVITDQAFSVIGFIGVVALIGLVGKNAILLVDYTNTLRERGRNRHDAITEAGPTRLRPIVMTTVALILGTLPVAMALGRGSEFRQSIGTIVLGGIILSTLLTLVVIPCSYTIFDDLSNLFAKWLKKPIPFGGPEGYGVQSTEVKVEEATIEGEEIVN